MAKKLRRKRDLSAKATPQDEGSDELTDVGVFVLVRFTLLPPIAHVHRNAGGQRLMTRNGDVALDPVALMRLGDTSPLAMVFSISHLRSVPRTLAVIPVRHHPFPSVSYAYSSSSASLETRGMLSIAFWCVNLLISFLKRIAEKNVQMSLLFLEINGLIDRWPLMPPAR